MARDASATVPYAPWTTFNTALETLRANGLPDKLDRSVFKGQSGGTQAVLMASFKAAGGIDEDNVVQLILRKMVDPAQRKAAFKELAETRYKEVLALPSAATQAQFDQVFRDYGLNGATHRKAKAFFLRLADEVGITLSKHISVGTSNGTPGTPPKPRRSRQEKKDKPNSPPAPRPPSAGGEALFHPAIDAFLRESRKLIDGDSWSKEARDYVVQTFVSQLDLFLPVKPKGRGSRKETVSEAAIEELETE